ncbi:MAG: fibronectin type III domain-containing protein [bacterium]|nr:fibronectin type III domain-containing protein [bacterium]
MAKTTFSAKSPIGVRPAKSGGHPRARRRVTTWAALGVLALLATLLTPLSTASAQPSPPAAPTITSVTPSDGAVTLTWDAGADGGATVTRWEYTQSVPATNVWFPIPRSDRNTSRHTVTGLDNGTAYQFRVRAVNDAGYGAESDASTAATPSTVPMAPVGLRGEAGNSEIVLSWTPAATDGTTANRQNGWSPISRYEYRQ